ncbi:hypothetical protein FRC12_022208 [Ceratobasidium sp. 428]|nr:hypothetical protein FRC12_022208 [Ceratobasidium sp. 428]
MRIVGARRMVFLAFRTEVYSARKTRCTALSSIFDRRLASDVTGYVTSWAALFDIPWVGPSPLHDPPTTPFTSPLTPSPPCPSPPRSQPRAANHERSPPTPPTPPAPPTSPTSTGCV